MCFRVVISYSNWVRSLCFVNLYILNKRSNCSWFSEKIFVYSFTCYKPDKANSYYFFNHSHFKILVFRIFCIFYGLKSAINYHKEIKIYEMKIVLSSYFSESSNIQMKLPFYKLIILVISGLFEI